MSGRKISPFTKQCFVTAGVCSNLVGFGCVIGFPGILLPQLHRDDALITLSDGDDSWIAPTTGITLLIGSYIVAPIMGKLGRKFAHFTITISAIVGWIITILATGFTVLMVGRVISGLSYGMMLPIRSVLVGEYTSPKNRGGFLTTVSLSQGSGIFFVHLVGSLLSWQQTGLICIVFPFVSLIMLIYSPESPSWLAAVGKYEECRRVFRWLRGSDEEDELEEMIRARLDFKMTNVDKKTNLKEVMRVIRKKEFYKPIILMVHTFVMGQFSGCTSMASFSTVIIGLIMGSGVNAHFWMVALDTQRIISNSLAIYLINRARRRTMMFSTGSLGILSHLAIAGYVYLRNKDLLPYDALWISALLINLQFFSVATGMMALPTVIGGEVFPLEYRSIAGSISLTAISLAFFAVSKTFLGLVDSFGIDGTYAIYAGILTYCIVVIWMLLPETKGKTLQQIEDEFSGRLTRENVEETVRLRS